MYISTYNQDGLSSEGFAHLAAAVFMSRGFRVFLMGGTVATPLVAFGVSHTEACAGVMVTASHNPKKDNGYKVYWGNGSQIIPPHDKGIAASIQTSLEPWQVCSYRRGCRWRQEGFAFFFFCFALMCLAGPGRVFKHIGFSMPIINPIQ